MKKRDLLEMRAVYSVYALAYSLDELFDQVCSDLPEECDAESFRGHLRDFMCGIGLYNESKRELFLNACEDHQKKGGDQ